MMQYSLLGTNVSEKRTASICSVEDFFELFILKMCFGVSRFLQNVCNHQANYTVSHFRKLSSYKHREKYRIWYFDFHCLRNNLLISVWEVVVFGRSLLWWFASRVINVVSTVSFAQGTGSGFLMKEVMFTCTKVVRSWARWPACYGATPSTEVMNSSFPGVGSLSRQLELVSCACVFEVVGGGSVLKVKKWSEPKRKEQLVRMICK